MKTLKKQFEQRLAARKPGAPRVDPAAIAKKLTRELEECFPYWYAAAHTGRATLPLVARVVFELAGDGTDVYAALSDAKNNSIVGDGAAPSLEAIGLESVAKDDPVLAAIALGLALEKVLPAAVRSASFKPLPREAKLRFQVGVHGTWEDNDCFVLKGPRTAPPKERNPRLKQLAVDFNLRCLDKEPGAVGRLSKQLREIDLDAEADRLRPTLLETFKWLKARKLPPIDRMRLLWSTRNEEAPVWVAGHGETVVTSPVKVSLKHLLPLPPGRTLSSDERATLRYATMLKLAQIACKAMEGLVELPEFRTLSKTKTFTMTVMNRTAGSPPRFYPFK